MPFPTLFRSSPSPSSASRPERFYTGPDPSTLQPSRDRTQAEKYFARVANENIAPGRLSKMIGVGGWLLGGFVCVYMALYADFGPREHVFSPLRRSFNRYTNDLFTLSSSERSLLGLDQSPQIRASTSPITKMNDADAATQKSSRLL